GEESQLTYLKWLGLDWDEGPDKGGNYGPYRQMERLDLYKKYVDELLERDLAYECFMTSEELEAEREAQIAAGKAPQYSGAHSNLTEEEREAFRKEGRKPSIRIRVPQNKTYTFNDIVRKNISFESSDIGDWVIVKKDGIPTFNFAVVIDDHLMGITDTSRGRARRARTATRTVVYHALAGAAPPFASTPLLLPGERSKFSKR